MPVTWITSQVKTYIKRQTCFLEQALSENECFQMSVWCLTVHIFFMCRTETRSYTEAQGCSAVMQVSQPCSPQIKPTSRTRGKALRCWYFSLKELWLFPSEPSLYVDLCDRCQPLHWGVGKCDFSFFDWSLRCGQTLASICNSDGKV